MDILKGEKVQLRAVEPNDIDIIYKWENNTSVWQLSNTLAPFSRHIIKQFVDNSHLDIFQSRQLRLMIDKIENDSAETIGTIDIFDFEPLHKRAGIGILIADEQNRKNGFASEALDILIHYCFNTLQMYQLYCNITSDNTESLNLFQKKGFSLIGIKKDWLIFPKGKKDELMFQLINA